MLFTGRTSFDDVVRTSLQRKRKHPLPLDHWLDVALKKNEVAIASVCPKLFRQRTDKASSIDLSAVPGLRLGRAGSAGTGSGAGDVREPRRHDRGGVGQKQRQKRKWAHQ